VGMVCAPRARRPAENWKVHRRREEVTNCRFEKGGEVVSLVQGEGAHVRNQSPRFWRDKSGEELVVETHYPHAVGASRPRPSR